MGNRRSREYEEAETKLNNDPTSKLRVSSESIGRRKISAPDNRPDPISSVQTMTSTRSEKIPCRVDGGNSRRQHKLSVGESSLPNMANNRQLTRKHSHQVTDKNGILNLSDQEKTCLIESWTQLIAHQPAFISQVWLAAIDRSPTIKSTFITYHTRNQFRRAQRLEEQKEEGRSFLEEQQNESETPFLSLTKSVHDFFHRLVIIDRLDLALMRSACASLGQRHKSYSQHGFQPVFFDIFIVCFLERLESEGGKVIKSLSIDRIEGDQNEIGASASRSGGGDSKEEKPWEIVYAWQKFLRMVVDMMREGFIKPENAVVAKN